MNLFPHIAPYKPGTLACRVPKGHNLHFVVGTGASFREAYNDWLNQLKEYC